MARKEALNDFKKMWTWLCANPAYGPEYYIKNIIKGNKLWINYCPLCNQTKAKDCDGCKILWNSESGTLCTDPLAPIYKWKTTAIDEYESSNRSFYASQAAVLAMRYIKNK